MYVPYSQPNGWTEWADIFCRHSWMYFSHVYRWALQLASNIIRSLQIQMFNTNYRILLRIALSLPYLMGLQVEYICIVGSSFHFHYAYSQHDSCQTPFRKNLFENQNFLIRKSVLRVKKFIDVLKSLEITLILQNFFSQSFSDWQLQLNTRKNN